MHGRKRDEYKAIHRDPTMVRKLSTKAIAWHTLQRELLSLQKQQPPTPVDVTTTATTTISSTDHLTIDTNTLVLLEKAVSVNPDPIWLWNFRRTLIQHQLQSISSASTSVEPTCRIFDKEHEITQMGLQNNPKAYAVWHYRKWCIQQQIRMIIPFHSTTTTTAADVVVQLLQTELHLCHLLLQKDERNFHCWSYRRFIVSCCISYHDMGSQKPSSTTTTSPIMTGEWMLPHTEIEGNDVLMGAQIAMRHPSVTSSSVPDLHLTTDSSSCMTILKQEWEFTTTKIYENFSNFSAFHYRSKLLPLMMQMMQSSGTDTVDTASISTDSCGDRDDQMTFQMIKDEFDLITNAIYTEPDDQTAWWYQIFLFHYLTTHVLIRKNANLDTLLTKYNEQIVQPHMQQVRELKNETNSSSKWVLIGLLQCLQYVRKYHLIQPLHSTTAFDHVDFGDMQQERRMILQTLIQIDPDRKERYKYKLRQIR